MPEELQQPVTPEPAQPAETDEKPIGDKIPAWVLDPNKAYEEIQALRQENAEHRKAKKSAEAAAQEAERTRLAEQGQYQKLYEEANAQLQQLRDELKASQVAALRSKVASELGIPPQLAERLRGETEEEMKQDAESLKAVIPQPSASGTQPKQTTVGVPGGRPAAETDAQRLARLTKRQGSSAFDGGGVVNFNK